MRAFEIVFTMGNGESMAYGALFDGTPREACERMARTQRAGVCVALTAIDETTGEAACLALG